MKDQEIIDVVTAHRDGKTIEAKARTEDSAWGWSFPMWDFDRFDYRVKPEPPKPREFWINVYPNDAGLLGHRSKESASRCKGNEAETIHVREVIE